MTIRWDPSHDVDRYFREAPEECRCGKPNSTDDGEWIYPQRPTFCSAECAAAQDQEDREINEGEAAYYEQMAREDAELAEEGLIGEDRRHV